MSLEIKQHILKLINLLDSTKSSDLSIIPWATPILSFGNISKSKIATLGINPSNREFVDLNEAELVDGNRRFHTLSSLGISKWSDIEEDQLKLILDSYDEYFHRNPYDGWFKKLDYLISGSSLSYYFPSCEACHLDLIPFATEEKWSNLNATRQNSLLQLFGTTLGELLRDSSIEILLLNGQTVVSNFQKISNVQFKKNMQQNWVLSRKSGNSVTGYSYEGYVSYIGNINLNREIKVLGYNHNIQSSFGVSSEVLKSMREWISKNTNIFSYETRRHSTI